jgi:hypothetical protein
MMKYLFKTTFLILVLGLTQTTARAATNYFPYLDVSANTYAPFTYTQYAKTLPIPGSIIGFTLNLFQTTETTIKKQVQTQYQLLDPSAYKYSWYINERLIQEKQGENTFKYTVPRGISLNAVSLTIEVRNKNNLLLARKKTLVPIKDEPEIQVHALINDKLPLTSTEVVTGTRGQTIKLVALPYFFNVQNLNQLSFLWYDGRKKLPAESYQQNLLEITLPQYSAQNTFTSVIYNTGFDLELGQKDFRIISQ